MAVTKSQLAVWGLIAGLSVGGYAALSRVKLPDEVPAPVAAARAAVVTPRMVVAAPAVPEAPGASAVAALPATIPEFPFPDDLMTDAVDVAMVPDAVATFAGIPGDAMIPQISTLGENDITVAAAPEAVAPEVPTIEEPPIPMPARPMMARPLTAVPLSEVKTLYVVAETLNIRAMPSTSGTVLQKVGLGFAVAPRQRSDEWIGFLMQDGATGWMRTDYLSDTMPPQLDAAAAAAGTEPLNLMM